MKLNFKTGSKNNWLLLCEIAVPFMTTNEDLKATQKNLDDEKIIIASKNVLNDRDNAKKYCVITEWNYTKFTKVYFIRYCNDLHEDRMTNFDIAFRGSNSKENLQDLYDYINSNYLLNYLNMEKWR